METQFESVVVSSLDSGIALGLVEFEGVHRIANRDAVGFYFTTQSVPSAPKGRIAVLFSGTSILAKPEYFGLPDFGDRDTNFLQFALAAVGDFLDENGAPPFTPSGVSAAQVECFSGRFQAWQDRPASADDAVVAYIKGRLYWTWKHNLSRTLFTSHDLLRVGVRMADLHRLATLEEGRLWRTHSKSDFGISLEPTPELLRDVKASFDTPVPPPNAPETRNPLPDPVATRLLRPPPKRKTAKASSLTKPKKRRGKAGDTTDLVFIDEARLTDLRQLRPADFDLRKLIAICDELNLCYRSQCYFAVAALTRALLDHVPPVFGTDSFAQVANNYAGSRSFRGSMQHLESSARNIADGHLHTRIRKKESVPTRTQVNFTNDVDVLLAEVVRLLS